MFKKHTNKRKNRSCATGTTNFAQLHSSHNEVSVIVVNCHSLHNEDLSLLHNINLSV